MENYLDTLFDQSNELYLKYINNYISIKRLKKVIHQYPNYIKNDNVILKIFFKKNDDIITMYSSYFDDL